ncbi:unnamed protein product [Phaedon cochleariae]|uniref:Uncharacterized protein n=1 Tax=Phaedon cochleariae TaxID=80249 RepID=A0A9P0GSK7_PHACE|nr:unnamed protein product [Phaedon cochleariae]
MYRILIVLSLIGILQFPVDSKKLPTYILPCRKSDPNLNDCAKQHAIDSLPRILEGDKAYKIPNFLPVLIPLVDVQQGNDLKFQLKDLHMYGLNTTHIQDLVFDLDKKHFYVKILIDEALTESRYEVDGKILTLPIKGEGPARINSKNITVEYSFDYQLIKKADGKQYFDVDNLKTNIICKVGHTHYHFGNLFGGNKVLGDNFNQVLNDNEKELEETAGASNNEIINAIVSTIFNSFFRTISYDEMFLD